MTTQTFSLVWLRCFVTFIESLSHDEKRDKTALDEVLGALQYVVDSTKTAEPKKKRAKTSSSQTGRDSTSTATMSTTSFCMSMFLEFVLQGEVSVNGKLIKAYSNLRSELQQIMLSAQETFVSETADGKEIDAMELAVLLTEQFADKPVLAVVGDDEEEACAKRVVSALNVDKQRDATVKPLQDFIAKKLHLPLMLHPVPQQTLLEVAALKCNSNSSMNTIIDLVAFIQSKLDELFPFAWVFFSSDVAEVLACKGHFIDSSAEAGRHRKKLFI